MNVHGETTILYPAVHTVSIIGQTSDGGTIGVLQTHFTECKYTDVVISARGAYRPDAEAQWSFPHVFEALVCERENMPCGIRFYYGNMNTRPRIGERIAEFFDPSFVKGETFRRYAKHIPQSLLAEIWWVLLIAGLSTDPRVVINKPIPSSNGMVGRPGTQPLFGLGRP